MSQCALTTVVRLDPTKELKLYCMAAAWQATAENSFLKVPRSNLYVWLVSTSSCKLARFGWAMSVRIFLVQFVSNQMRKKKAFEKMCSWKSRYVGIDVLQTTKRNDRHFVTIESPRCKANRMTFRRKIINSSGLFGPFSLIAERV